MKGRRFLGALLVGMCTITSASAHAQPSPVTSIVPRFIRVVGAQTVAGVPDPRGAFTITVNDAIGAALAGVPVTIDFGGCLETRLCSAQVGAAVLACAAGTRQITGVTNALGNLTVTILGGGTNPGVVPPPGTDPGAGAGCAAISAGAPPVALGNATVVLFDENGALPAGGSNGVNGLDLSLMLPQLAAAQFGAPYHGRVDFDQNGIINAIDLSFFLALALYPSAALVGSGAGCATAGAPAPYCPF